MNKTLLFIPAFNCASQIHRVLLSILPHASLFQQILLIDNQSQDGTVAESRRAIDELGLENTKILINPVNISLGGSHKVAFDFALKEGFNKVVVLHGDDQADIADLVAEIKVGAHLGTDCLLGARFHPDSRLIGYSRFRIFGNLLLNLMCSLVCRRRILDMGSGINLYSSEFLKDTRYRNFSNDLTFNIFLLFHACFNNYKIKFFPISWKEEDQISNAKVFRQMWIILGLCFKTLLCRNSLYAFNASKAVP